MSLKDYLAKGAWFSSFVNSIQGSYSLWVRNIIFLRFQFDSHSVHLQMFNICGVLKTLVLTLGEICLQNLVLF